VDLLEQLDHFAHKSEAMSYSTACYAALDPATGVLEHASAGHPPILLIDPLGATRFLEGGLSWPLCAVARVREPHGTALLEPGATIVLYSDGLIERRGEAIDRGLERLLDAGRRASGLAVNELCGVLVADLLDGQAILDDVVVLALRLAASPAASRTAAEGAAPTLRV
jgi:serine phosphatase RsbU (regulator of sigma subunit)